MTLKLEPIEVKRLNVCQNKLGLQWLNVIPCKNLKLKLSNQQLRIAIELLPCSKICEKHRCVCKKSRIRRRMAWHILSQKFSDILWALKLECPYKAKSRIRSHSFCLIATKPPQDKSEVTRRFDARPMAVGRQLQQ